MKRKFSSEYPPIFLKLYSSSNKSEWEFMTNTLITFEGMIINSLKVYGQLYHLVPVIELVFVDVSTESNKIYTHRLKEIQNLLQGYKQRSGSLHYMIDDRERPVEWAKDFVHMAIVNREYYS